MDPLNGTVELKVLGNLGSGRRGRLSIRARLLNGDLFISMKIDDHSLSAQ